MATSQGRYYFLILQKGKQGRGGLKYLLKDNISKGQTQD